MVQVEWKVPLERFMVYSLYSSVGNYWIVNMRLDGALRGKQRIIGWEGWGEGCGNPTPPRLYPPPLLVKDRWIGSCKQVLNVLITYWRYEPSKSM
jgi:hypothetical protein